MAQLEALGLPHAENTVLVGLHTCGDLAVTMLRAFASDRGSAPAGLRITGLINVPFCYNLLSETHTPQGAFPLSTVGKDWHLGRHLRLAAAESTSARFVVISAAKQRKSVRRRRLGTKVV